MDSTLFRLVAHLSLFALITVGMSTLWVVRGQYVRVTHAPLNRCAIPVCPVADNARRVDSGHELDNARHANLAVDGRGAWRRKPGVGMVDDSGQTHVSH